MAWSDPRAVGPLGPQAHRPDSFAVDPEATLTRHMPATPLVSLLIPTCNSGRTVADSIASCFSQSFQDIEILLYDEASRDNTRDIFAAAAARDSRVRVMTSDLNSGPVRAWR